VSILLNTNVDLILYASAVTKNLSIKDDEVVGLLNVINKKA